MTRLEALAELERKVRAWDEEPFLDDSFTDAWGVVAPSMQTDRIRSAGQSADALAGRATMGDLNAAKALHEVVLPGWDWLVRKSGWCSLHSPDFDSVTWEAGDSVTTDILSGVNVVVRDEPDPARAWLLAIIHALKSEAENG